MSVRIELQVRGLNEAALKLKLLPDQVSRAMRVAMSRSIEKVYRRVADNLTGRALRVDTGRLRQSLQTSVAIDGSSAKIGTNVEYASIHEFGGTTKPHVIRPRGKALLFLDPRFSGTIRQHQALLTKAGKIRRSARIGVVYARSVQHPGAMMPARPYLRPALRESVDDISEIIQRELGRAVKEGT